MGALLKLCPAWSCAPRFPQVETRPCQRDGDWLLFPFLAAAALAYPAISTPKPTPNLELSPLNTTSFAEHCLHRETEPRCNRRGSCHHNLNDPSLPVPLNNLLSRSSLVIP